MAPYRRLALAVLKRAVEDARGDCPPHMSKGAAAFLLSPARDRDLAWWCEMAGVTTARFRELLIPQMR